MGKGAQEQYLVTPPASTFLAAQASESLPLLVLGPSHIQVGGDAAGGEKRRRRSSSVSSTVSAADAVQTPAKQGGRRPPTKKSRPSRKTTHSQIEKRRREKINDTMQRLKDLVPACHSGSDLNLRKLDVLTATADYIEELQKRLRLEPVSPATDHRASSGSISPYELVDAKQQDHEQRRSSRPRRQHAYAESPISNPREEDDEEEVAADSSLEVESESRTDTKSFTYQQPQLPRNATGLQDEEYNAAESLIQIAESPMLGPVIERQRLSISELMHLS